jgi:uncharacterized protein (TIRG00374 family)
MNENKPRWRIWIAVFLIIIIIVILAYIVDWDKVLQILKKTDWRIMGVAAIALIIGCILISVRWRYLLANKPGLMNTFHADSMGYNVTMISPLPAPVLRVVTQSQVSSLPLPYVSSAMVVESLLGMVMRIISLIVIYLVTASLSESFFSIIIGIALIILTLGGIIWLVNNTEQAMDKITSLASRLPFVGEERAQKITSGLGEGLAAAGSKRRLAVGISYSLIMSIFFLIFFYLAWLAIPGKLNTGEMLVMSLAALVVVPPTAPAMPGVYNGVLVAALLLVGVVDVTVATAYSIVVYIVQFVFWLIMGIWGYLRTDLKIRELVSGTHQVREEAEQADQDNSTS